MIISRFLNCFLILAIIAFAPASFAQNNWQPQTYNGIGQNEQTSVLNEEFNDNNNKWEIKSDKVADIELFGGYLNLKSENEKISEIIPVEINENENFQIETSVRFVSGNAGRALGLQWGKSKKANRYFSFVISSDGKLAIGKFSGAYITFKQEDACKLIKPTGFNKLTIRKADNMAYFFLNEQLVYSMEYRLSYGNLIGIQTGGGNEVQVDYIKINSFSYRKINMPPVINLLEPVLDNYNAIEIDKDTKSIRINGTVKDEQAISSIEIGGKEYEVDASGYFSAEITIKPCAKSIRILATDRQLQEAEEFINLRYKKIINSSTTPSIDIKGKYYALIIAVHDYASDGISDLDGPLPDANRLTKILTDFYTFDKENINQLINPTREDLIVAFDNLSKTLSPDDNLLIFYAGHGFWDEENSLGYWLPTDATLQNRANWFMNSTIKTYIATIKTKHILLITDACFSGSIFKTRGILMSPVDISEKYVLPSRKAMTSGNLVPVPDNSEFLKQLTKNLIDNKEKFITSEKLFKIFNKEVQEVTGTDPQFGTIGNAGDQGGDFIFIKK